MADLIITGSDVTQQTRYATIDQLKRWLADNTAHLEDRDTELARALDSASRKIDNKTGRVFYRTNGEERIFYPHLIGRVEFVDLIAATTPTIVADFNLDGTPETTILATQYQLGPANEEGQSVLRYQWVRPSTNTSRLFYPDVRFSITGDWGYVTEDNEPPDDIVQATIILAARLYMRRFTPTGGDDPFFPSKTSKNVEGTQTSPDTDYRGLIADFIHPRKAFLVV